MIINNFFSDTLLSVLELFEKYLFGVNPFFSQNQINQEPKSFFKKVQFNIGNRNFQIGDYKESAQLEFPTGIFTFVNDETAFGKMASLIDHHRINDVNEIVCTRNKNTNVEIILREEQAILYLTVQINCESIHHANEVVHQIKRFLPPSKYVQLMPFSSFLPIPSMFFDTEYNNPRKHLIENLFMRYDETLGTSDYFFLSHYKPMIKLNSVNADISDNSSRSTTVLCDFSYLIQLPMWLFDSYDPDLIARINLGLSTGSSTPSSIIVDNNFLNNSNEPTKINDRYYSVKDQYIIDQNSSNYKNDKIIIPKPSNDDYSIQVAKLKQRESTVVNYIDTVSIKNKEGLYTTSKNILSTDDYVIKDNAVTGEKEIVIITTNKLDLTPELNSPIVISIILPMDESLLVKKKKSKSYFDKVYKIRKQKTWKTK